jgi:hypothetical protein
MVEGDFVAWEALRLTVEFGSEMPAAAALEEISVTLE